MSSARAYANQSLYLARIQLQGWAQALEGQSHPASVIDQAFAPAVREHLLDAFGWFALNILAIAELPSKPPHRCSELPAVAAGKSVPGEIREFQQLEQEGWLGQLQAPLPPPGRPMRTPGNLAVAGSGLPDRTTMAAWADSLAAVVERMGDSLDEC